MKPIYVVLGVMGAWLIYAILSSTVVVPPCDVEPTPEEISPAPTPEPETTPKPLPILPPAPVKQPDWMKTYHTVDLSLPPEFEDRPCYHLSVRVVKKLRMSGYDAYCITFRNEDNYPPITHCMVYIINSDNIRYILEPQNGRYWVYGSEEFEAHITKFLGLYPDIRKIWLPYGVR